MAGATGASFGSVGKDGQHGRVQEAHRAIIEYVYKEPSG